MRGFECNSVRSFVLLTLFVFGVSGTLNVNQNRESVTLRVGEDEHLQCSTTLIIKGCMFLTPQGDQFFIFDTANYGRIEAASETDMECKIRIPSISEQDNGDWKCIITALSEDGTPIQGNATISVTVAVPPSKMELFVDGVEAESTDLQMKLIPDDHKEIKCVALHARPAPTFTWTLNEEPLHGNIEDSEEVLENGTVNYAQTLLYYPDAKHNGVELKCSLSHEAYSPAQLDSRENERGLNIKLLYKPLESEKTQEFYVQSEGEAKTFNMVFEAFPEPTEVYWDLSGMESHLQQGDTSFNDKYTSSELTPGDTNGEYSISLTIEGVSVEDTKNESSLFVKNSEGETEYKFKIKLGREPAAESMGSGPVVGVVIIILIILILIGLALLIRSKGLFCFAAKGGEPLEEEKDGAAFDGMEKGESVPPPPVVKPESLKTPEDKKATPEETKPLTEPLTVNEPKSVEAPAPVSDEKKEEGSENK